MMDGGKHISPKAKSPLIFLQKNWGFINHVHQHKGDHSFVGHVTRKHVFVVYR